ncbi:MAG: hypothetical protein FJW69_02505 [Actinobacteria bacterium]|nr:hypothetical protein [Actinomycetota bacterium]
MMNRKTITVLIVLTAIFALVIFTILKKETAIVNVLLSDKAELTENELKNIENAPAVFNKESEIYAAISVKNITKEDTISIKWEIIDNNNDNTKTIQEDRIVSKEEGSGEIAVSLARKNNQHETGKYRVYVRLNNQATITKEFTVK